MIFDHPDEIGSATTATDCTGSLVNEKLYYPFGEFWTGYAIPDLKMHQEFAQLPDYDPETDQYNTGNRHYSPMGRCPAGAGPEPWGLKAAKLDDAQTWNVYACVRNNATSLTDPSGLDFYLQCADKDHKGCTQVTIGKNQFWVQADSSGNATIVTSNSIRLGQNSATVNGSGVIINGTSEGIYFDNPASHATDNNGNDVNMNPITLQGDASKGFGGFTFNINGNCGGTCLSSGSFQFNGTPDQAREALNAAGAWSYVTDSTLDQMFHPNSEQFRFGSGPSPHFSLPDQQIVMPGSMEHEVTVPNPLSTVPASGGFHVDETTGLSHTIHAVCRALGLGC